MSSSRLLPSILISATALIFSVSCHLFKCLNHYNLLPIMTIAIGSTLASSNISSFLLVSCRITPVALSTSLFFPFTSHLLLTLAMFRSRKTTSVEPLFGIAGPSFLLDHVINKSNQISPSRPCLCHSALHVCYE